MSRLNDFDKIDASDVKFDAPDRAKILDALNDLVKARNIEAEIRAIMIEESFKARKFRKADLLPELAPAEAVGASRAAQEISEALNADVSQAYSSQKSMRLLRYVGDRLFPRKVAHFGVGDASLIGVRALADS